MARLRLILIAISLTAVGCADPNTGTVSGTITVDDDLPETGYIGFTAIDGKTGPVGGEIVDGLYSVTLPIGEMKVAIRVPKVTGEKKLYEGDPNSPVQKITEESLPRWYNEETELTHVIVAGESTKDFELSTSKKRKK